MLTHHLLQHVFALRTDRGQVPQIDNQFAVPKICSGVSAGVREFGGPRRCESALNDQSALARFLDNRDLQHVARILDARECATHAPGVCDCNYLVFQRRPCDQLWSVVSVKTALTLQSAESNVRNNREDRCQVFSSGPGESSGSHASAPQLRPPLPLVPSL